MSVAELQSTISRLTAPQKRAVARYIQRLTEEESATRAAKIGRLLRATDAAPKYTVEQIKTLRRRPAAKA